MDVGERGSYRHILKYTSLFGGVQGLSVAISLVRNKVVALLLEPSGMGLVSLFSVAISFVSQVTSLGLPFSAVRHVSELYEEGNATATARFVGVVRCWCLLTALVGTVAFAVLGTLFSDSLFALDGYQLHFVLLSPIVAMTAITGCETALLKGARRLKRLATVQIWSVVAALAVSVPIYWFFGFSGIVPVLLLCSAANMILTLRQSLRSFPLDMTMFNRQSLGRGGGMVRLGVAFQVAGLFTYGTEMVIRAFLNNCGDLNTVGLYNAGFTLVMTYGGLVFTAMETDYFPRLSSVNHDNRMVVELANRQIEVTLLLMSPLLVAMTLFLPLLVPFLYSGKFAPIVAMAQVAVFALYFKSVTSPVAYITLAKGRSKSFVVLEAAYAIMFVALFVFLYRCWGLFGTGVALAVANLLDLVMITLYANRCFGYRPTAQVLHYAALQYPIGAAAYAVTLLYSSWLYWVVGVALLAVSAGISLYIIIYKKTGCWPLRRNSGQ